MVGEVCKHGSLARVCEICELTAERDTALARVQDGYTQLAARANQVETLQARIAHLESVIEAAPHDRNCKIFTCAECGTPQGYDAHHKGAGQYYRHEFTAADCTCWKARAQEGNNA